MAGDAGGGSAREGERAAVSASADAAPHNAHTSPPGMPPRSNRSTRSRSSTRAGAKV